MGFFDLVEDLSEIPDDPFHLPEDIYPVIIIEAAKKPTAADPKKFGLSIKSSITDGPYKGRQLSYWLWTPTEAPEDDNVAVKQQQAFSSLINFFKCAGYGMDEMNDIDAADLIGKEQKWRTRNKKNDDRTNINIAAIYPLDDPDESDAEANYSYASDDKLPY